MAAAPKKKGLASIRKSAIGVSLSRLTSGIPFLKKRASTSPEPFSAIEDDTPMGDLLSATNVAPGMTAQGPAREKVDFRALLEVVVNKPAILAGVFAFLALLLALAVTSAIVTAPPSKTVAAAAAAAAAPFSEKGESLVKTWLPPPGDPLEPRMAMEREGAPAYSAQDAARLGVFPDPVREARLREMNDQTVEDLLGTVP